VAWVSLDDRDNDPGTFWTYVVTALHGVAGGVGSAALDLLRSPQPPTEAALVSLVNELQELPSEVVLVLDDYHVVESREIHDGMAFLLEHLPAQANLLLATPGRPAAAARAAAGARRAGRGPRDRPAVHPRGGCRLPRRADGTGAGSRRRHDPGRAHRGMGRRAAAGRPVTAGPRRPGAAVARFAGDDRFIVDYLAEEVLARQPADVRGFLLRTSVLDRLTGGLCDAVTGQAGGAARLVALERANLFLVPLDDHRQWYRYHHLFADVLRAHLLEQQPDEVGRLHRRASAWFQDHGDPADAIRHALAGGDHVPRKYVRRLQYATTTRPDGPPSAQPLVEPLSDRELDVLRLLATALDGPEIARELTVSLNTLRTHTKRIYLKLGVTSRRAAVARGQALRLLPGQRKS
jgi:LuxR family maltose regulon positive regulatory protein